jgi:hypothetical protein
MRGYDCWLIPTKGIGLVLNKAQLDVAIHICIKIFVRAFFGGKFGPTGQIMPYYMSVSDTQRASAQMIDEETFNGELSSYLIVTVRFIILFYLGYLKEEQTT